VRTNHRGARADVNLATLGYSVQLGSLVCASLTAFRSFIDARTWGAGVMLSYALDERRFLSGGVSHNDGHAIATVQLQQGLPADTGFGYDVRAQAGETSGFGARLLYQNGYGNYGIEAGNSGGQLNVSAGASGGIVTMGGHTMFARRVQDSFAMVEVPGAPGVDIYSNNQRVATTNASGVGLVPNLLPYQRNTLRVDDRGLPVELELDLGEKTVAPHARSGVLVTFAAKLNNGATLMIVTDDHEWMPLGSEVRAGSATAAYHVARRGEVFLPEISYPATVRVVHGGRSCSFTVPQPVSREPLPRLGPFKCRSTSVRASL
jgi:outer membrane usher protein